MAGFGFSPSDIVEFSKFANRIVNALKEDGGAKSEYIEAVSWCEDFCEVLGEIQNLGLANVTAAFKDKVAVQAEQTADYIVGFRKRISKYDKEMGAGSKAGARHGVVKKVQWALQAAKELDSFCRILQMRTKSVELFMASKTLQHVDQIPSLRKEAGKFGESVSDLQLSVRRIGEQQQAMSLQVRTVFEEIRFLRALGSPDFLPKLAELTGMITMLLANRQNLPLLEGVPRVWTMPEAMEFVPVADEHTQSSGSRTKESKIELPSGGLTSRKWVAAERARAGCEETGDMLDSHNARPAIGSAGRTNSLVRRQDKPEYTAEADQHLTHTADAAVDTAVGALQLRTIDMPQDMTWVAETNEVLQALQLPAITHHDFPNSQMNEAGRPSMESVKRSPEETRTPQPTYGAGASGKRKTRSRMGFGVGPDPLATAASVIGMAAFATQMVSILQAFHHIPNRLLRVSERLQELVEMLRDVADCFAADEDIRTAKLVIERTSHVLSSCDRILKPITDTGEIGTGSRAMNRFRFLMKRDELEEELEELESLKMTLSCILQTQQLKIQKRQHHLQLRHAQSVQKLEDDFGRVLALLTMGSPPPANWAFDFDTE